MKESRRLSPINTKSIDQLNAYIANNPAVTYQDLVKKSLEMGHNPHDLIDAALGSAKYEKSSARLDQSLEDILNSVYEKDPTPGRRYVMEPSEAISPRGKDVAKALEGNLGVAQSLNTGRPRSLPDFAAVRQQYNELGKLQAIAHAGHELEHQKDYLIRPNIEIKTPQSYKVGHHYSGIYEPRELIREVKDLPVNQKEISEIVKQSKKAGLKSTPFMRLRQILGPLVGAAGLYSALKSGDATAAALEAASLVDPTGIADTAAEVNRRLKMSPEEREQTKKEDFYSAMPGDIANEQRMLDELEELKFKKVKEKLR